MIAFSEVRGRLLEAKKVIFHKNSHLDDAAAQWFLRDVVKISAEFVFQQNDRIMIDPKAGEIGLDVMHEFALKGYKNQDGGYSSVFRCLAEAFFPDVNSIERRALKPLIDWVDTNDSRGSVTRAWLGYEDRRIESVGLNAMFMAYKHQYSDSLDLHINQNFGLSVLEPLYCYHYHFEQEVDRALSNCRFELDGILGICEGILSPALIGWPQRHLVEMAQHRGQKPPQIFVFCDELVGMGMLRICDSIRLDNDRLKSRLTKVSQHWFFHPGGFLSACGTSTAPKDIKQAGVTLTELKEILKEIYAPI
ncbi:MAG: hypothetical protein H3C47_13280 [Candidatus Cloacimonetes bacterium]|nr:hypothetical protein [Candidatus Cloacimonadota bacterium]